MRLSTMQKQSMFLYMCLKGLQNISEWALGYCMKLMWMPFEHSVVLNMVELLEMSGILFLKEQHS